MIIGLCSLWSLHGDRREMAVAFLRAAWGFAVEAVDPEALARALRHGPVQVSRVIHAANKAAWMRHENEGGNGPGPAPLVLTILGPSRLQIVSGGGRSFVSLDMEGGPGRFTAFRVSGGVYDPREKDDAEASVSERRQAAEEGVLLARSQKRIPPFRP